MKKILVVIFCATIAGCVFGGKTVELNEEFELKKDETATILGTNLRLRVKSTGHDISESGGSVYCNIETNFNGALSDRSINIGKSITFDDLILKATGVDEPTNCTFLVIRSIEKSN